MKTKETVFDRVVRIVVEQLGVESDQVQPHSNFVDDLNADSLDLVEMIMAMEEEFFTNNDQPFEISDEEAEKLVKVQDVLDYLKDHGIEDE
ncbi:MAG: acyl carrier protein [Candidatus Woykebacteria bacterium]